MVAPLRISVRRSKRGKLIGRSQRFVAWLRSGIAPGGVISFDALDRPPCSCISCCNGSAMYWKAGSRFQGPRSSAPGPEDKLK